MKLVRFPSDQQMTGIPASGVFQPERISLFHEWGHISTDPYGQMSDRVREGYLEAGTAFVTHYRILGDGEPLEQTFSTQISAKEWCSIGLVRGSSQLARDSKKTKEGDVPVGSIEVRILRLLRGGWSESIRLINHDAKARETKLEIEIGCPIVDKHVANTKEDERSSLKNGIKPLVREDQEAIVLQYRRVFGRRKKAPTLELRKELGDRAPRDGEKVVRELELKVLTNQSNENGAWGRTQVSRGRISKIRFHFSIPAKGEAEISLRFSPRIDGVAIPAPELVDFDPLPHFSGPADRYSTEVVSGNSIVNLVMAQASTDLENFKLPLFGSARDSAGPETLLAGVPGYEAYFGDDSLTGAWQSCVLNPGYLRGALAYAALYQGVRNDRWRDEQPGRIAHQRTWNPCDVLGKRNMEIYYGDVETTPFWIISLATYFFWTGDLPFVREHESVLRGCLSWIQRGLRDGKGFLYYEPASKQSTRNQGWKDSDTAIVDRRGRIRMPPLATVELQAYVFLAYRLAAALLSELGDLKLAKNLFERSALLKDDFNRFFWMPEQSYYALALDRDRRHVDAIASNPGHCLGCGIIPSSNVPKVIGKLLSPSMFSGWGIRTLSSENPAYDPFSYHRGSVWAAENATIAAGMRLCGYKQEAAQVIEAQLAAATTFRQVRLPETMGGQERSGLSPIPGLYPKANPLQLWSISSNPFSLQILLGLIPIAPLGMMLVDPFLPEWLPWVELKGLRVGSARLHLRFWREASGAAAKTRWSILEQEGCCKLIEQPMPFDPSASVGSRIWDALKSAAKSAA